MRDEADNVTGRDADRVALEGIFQAIALQRELHIDGLSEEGDNAVARTHTTGTGAFLPTRTTIPAVGRELFVLKRSGDGWLISDNMHNRMARQPESAQPMG